MVDVKRIVAVAPEKLLESTPGSFIRLRHPHFDDGAVFFIKHEDGSLWETQRFHEKFRSWFVGNSLKSDGSLYFITPYDPLFIALRYLSKQAKFSPLDTVLDDPEFPAVKKIADMKLVTDRINLVADVKATAGFTVARYSEERALRWLEGRHSRVAQALMEHEVCCATEGTAQASCWRSGEASDPAAVREYAHGLLAECLTPEMGAALAERLGLETETTADENAAEQAKVEEAPPPKKRRSVVPTNDYQEVFNKLVDQKKETAESKTKPKLKKQPGMQSITNFFAKK